MRLNQGKLVHAIFQALGRLRQKAWVGYQSWLHRDNLSQKYCFGMHFLYGISPNCISLCSRLLNLLPQVPL
jgi:hypothetical protein